MELVVPLIAVCRLIVILAVRRSITSTGKTSEPGLTKHQACEKRVSDALRAIDLKMYVIFDNLILPSNGNTAHTEIDHVVVSPYGIFCIETKSHQGAIYGDKEAKYWTQRLGQYTFQLYNPFRQNYKHTKALEVLLGTHRKAPLHSYVVFPNASSIEIGGIEKVATIEEVVRQISSHKKQIYNLQDCERILKMIAYASTENAQFAELHKDEVRAYLSTEIA